MLRNDDHLVLRLAESEADLRAAERLRYRVFVAELGGDGDLVDHKNRLERDRFDPHFDHLVLIDTRRNEAELDHVVGVYRLMPDEKLDKINQFYSEDEYDLSPLKSSGRKLLELGRSCVHADYRGGLAMHHLWRGLAEYIRMRDIEVLFGVASFHGTDLDKIAASLAILHHRHLAPSDLRVRARDEAYQTMNLIPDHHIDRAEAMRVVPALIKAYLRLGGCVGDGAFIDHDFNTTDVCLVMDIARLNPRARAIYTGVGD